MTDVGQQPPDEEAQGEGSGSGTPSEASCAETREGPSGAVDDGAPPDDARSGTSPSGGLRLLGAAVTLPWVFLYGITGVWALGLAARSAAQGLKRIDAGYTRFVTPPQLAFVGALLLTAFAVLLACGLLLLFGRRSVVAWLPLLLIAAGLTSGAVWAGFSGGIHPVFWAFLFFGLAYVTVVALVRVLQVTRAGRRGRIVEP